MDWVTALHQTFVVALSPLLSVVDSTGGDRRPQPLYRPPVRLTFGSARTLRWESESCRLLRPTCYRQPGNWHL